VVSGTANKRAERAPEKLKQSAHYSGTGNEPGGKVKGVPDTGCIERQPEGEIRIWEEGGGERNRSHDTEVQARGHGGGEI